MTDKWNDYFEATKENPPSQTAMNALAQFGETCGSVIDLGCGAGTPKKFDSMWNEIVKGLKPNGVFAGVFFGNRDDWANDNFENRTFHTYEQVQDLLNSFTVISLEEEEWNGTCCGEDGQPIPKHWHIFRVVARKNEK